MRWNNKQLQAVRRSKERRSVGKMLHDYQPGDYMTREDYEKRYPALNYDWAFSCH